MGGATRYEPGRVLTVWTGLMVDRCRLPFGGASDGVSKDLCDGRADQDAGRLRHRRVQRHRAERPLRCQPGDFLCLAQPSRQRRGLLVCGRSHAPGTQPLRTDAALVERVEALRRRFPYFGPKKIRARLHMESPDLALPAASTIGDILTRAGLVEPVRRRRRPIDQGRRPTPPLAINSEWCIDFKGWFRTLDGQRVDPLTVTDNASRYLLQVQIVRQNQAEVKPVLERLFNDFGLPIAMRSDNGAPFGSNGAGGLSRVSIWLLKLGVEPHYGRPAKPQDNGRHERMHRTLKEQTSLPPAASAGEQQVRFNDFRQHFNEERPHESLDQTPPAKVWSASDRPMPAKVEDPCYDAHHEVRRVRTSGDIKWRGEHVFIGEALAG